jgi:Cdc6-like AAA superfamily ATPase
MRLHRIQQSLGGTLRCTVRANPFTYGNPISDPTRFFGRKREVEQVYSRLLNSESESSSIVGDRRVGKTSLLNYVAHPDVRQRYRLDPDRFIFVYVDLQIVDDATTPARLWQHLLQQMARNCKNPEVTRLLSEDLRDPATIDNFALSDLFDTIDDSGQHVIFLLDEFENITSNKNFAPDFFYGLRSLATHHNLSLITSSRRELIELCHSEAIRSSPFFNIFANINLRLFSDDEARELIDTRLAPTDVRFTDEELTTIFRIAGYHPYFVQAACYFLFDAYDRELPSPELRQRHLTQRFRDEATPHLADAWRNSDDHEQVALTVLALLERKARVPGHDFRTSELRELYARSDQLLSRLERRGLVASAEAGYCLFSSSFGEWIIGEITNTLDDQQEYGEWLAAHKGTVERLSEGAKSQLGEILPRIGGRYRDLIVEWISDPSTVTAAARLLRTVLGAA